MPTPMPTPKPTATRATPTPAAGPAAPPRFRCLQRPTGEWFTFAPGAPGSELPDATALFTETEARRHLADLGFTPPLVEQTLAWARAHAEVSSDETVPGPAGM
jgi:hypothetical protein